ncbi:hypothetical protein LMG7974_01434 [Campylobacter majalis]|uniref:DUF4868 domain-containing protein n=1 Tax=Campylobacter majalis TaxID=2790656 RepID=A0ABM8Q8J8_9BACT|nr:hypothetical protein [Campylobacter majalis]CAD7289273.1 hypothetical protein LMG7974_01434 [Campylobacter majalis]
MGEISIFGSGKKKFYKVATANIKNIWNYNKIDNLKKIDFMQEKGSYKLEEDEIFFIKLNKDESLSVSNLLNTTSANDISKKYLLDLEYVFVIKQNKIFFQRIFKTNLIDKPFWIFSDTATLHTKDTVLVLQNRTDIAFMNDKIYFFKFSDLTAVFKNLSHYYREASKEDLQIFRANKIIDIDPILNLEKLPKTSLQKIAQIIDNLQILNENFKIYKQYADEYVEIFDDNKIKIVTKQDIDSLHNIIFQKYFQTTINTEKRVANSFQKL